MTEDNQTPEVVQVLTPEQLEQEKKDLLSKYCHLNSRMTYPDAEDILKAQGIDYIRKRIKKLEKRQAKPKVPKDLSILIKGIATAYYLNDQPDMLDFIMKDLQYLGFTDITCAPKKEGDYIFEHIITFSGRHSDPDIQAVFAKTPRTDVLYQYKLAYGKLLSIPFGSTGQKEADCKNIQGISNLAYKISGNGSKDHPTYLQKTLGITEAKDHVRDTYHWTPIWEAEDVAIQQAQREADELKEAKRVQQSRATEELDRAAAAIISYLSKAQRYYDEFNEEMPVQKGHSGGYSVGVPMLTLTSTGTVLPTLALTLNGQECIPEE
jgi:hypothetical protein